MILTLLQQSYRPFVHPLWGGWDYWYLFLLPLALLVSVVYKSVRVDDLSLMPRQAMRACGKFIGSFILIAIALWVLMLFLEG